VLCIFIRKITSSNAQATTMKLIQLTLEIWGKAQRESARCHKSDWGKFTGVKFPGSKVTCPAHKCISIRKTRTIDLEWVNISRVISGVSGPKFIKFLLLNAVLIVLDNAFYRLSTAPFVLEIFAVKLESCRETY